MPQTPRPFLVPLLAASGVELALLSETPQAQAAKCAGLTRLALPDMTVVAAADVPAGPFIPADGLKGVTVPAFCRVQAVAAPAPDSRVGIGNGGYSSVLNYPAMADGLARGYAAVATDQGHQGEDLRFVAGHPGKVEDWADRAVHVMTDGAKLITRDALGHWPSRAYFSGCSTGGFQGMAETQRHPADYDGVAAGAPGYPRLNLSASFLVAWTANPDANGMDILPRAKLLMYFGWADNVSSARTGIDYYDSVERAVGDRARTQDVLRLFLAPGMGHCSGGPGPDQFDAIRALEEWVEHGKAPDRMVASHRTADRVDRTRPLCPYPLAARYDGSGSTDDAASFSCAPDTVPADPDAGLWLRRLQERDAR